MSAEPTRHTTTASWGRPQSHGRYPTLTGPDAGVARDLMSSVTATCHMELQKQGLGVTPTPTASSSSSSTPTMSSS